MAFTQTTFAPVGPSTAAAPNVYSYSSSDSLNTVTTTGYFTEKQFQLREKDVVFASLSTGDYILVIDSDTSTALFGGSLFEAKNVRIVNKPEDFPDPVAGVCTLEDNITYELGDNIEVDFVFTLGANNTIESAGGFDSSSLVTTASGAAMFAGVDVNFTAQNVRLGAANTTEVFNISATIANTYSFVCRDSTFLTSNKFGTFSDLLTETISVVNAIALNDGVTVTGTGTVLSIERLAISVGATGIGVDLDDSVNPTVELRDLVFIGTSGSIGVSGLANSGNIPTGSIGQIASCDFLGTITPLQNITTKDIRWSVSDSPPLRDSTVKGILYFENSALVTTISVADTPTYINAIWETDDVDERICFSDKVTFDNTTNTLTSVDGVVNVTGGTAFNHQMSNGDPVDIIENGGLPTGLDEGIYYVGDVSGSTFRLYQESSLTTLAEFTTNGTEPNYFCHVTGESASGWFVYKAERDVSLRIDGWISIEKVSGSAAGRRAVLMKTDTSFNITEASKASVIESRNGIALSSDVEDLVDFSEGEGFLIYLENIGDTVNNTVTDARVTAAIA